MQMQLEIDTLLTVGAAVATVIGTVYGFVRNFKQDVKTQIDKLDLDLKSQNADIKSQMSRTDQLYFMYVEGQRATMESQKNMDKKFYEILKEITHHGKKR